MKNFSWPLATLLLFSLAFNISASEITLKNGDRLTGKIVDESDDAITVETVYAGKVKIARSHIEKVVADPATKDAIKPVATAVQPKPEKAPVSVPSPAVVKKSSNGFSGRFRALATGWEGNANIGFSYTSGNSNNITMSTGLRASKTRPQDGFIIYARSLWNSNHGNHVNITTQNAFWGGARYDRTIDRRLFGFISYDFERDKPRHLNFRSVPGGGLGHRTIKNDRTELEFIAGGAWNRTWQTGNDTNTPEALAGFTFKQKLNDRMKFQNTMTFFQNVTDRNEYRFIFDATLSADVTKKVGFYFSVGDRFNNDPNGNAQRNDFLFTTGMKWNFGKKK